MARKKWSVQVSSLGELHLLGQETGPILGAADDWYQCESLLALGIPI